MDDNHQNEPVESEQQQQAVEEEVSHEDLKEGEISDGPPDRRGSDILSEAEEEYLRKMLSERRGSFRPQPIGTVAYEVQPSDTLEGIAIRYNITASELSVLNKLSSRVVFPGQTIYIPEKNSLQNLEEILKQSAAALVSSADEQSSPKPGRVERVPGEEKEHVNISVDKLLGENVVPNGSKESLRVNSKYVTDGEGVVSGVLIVTTNHLIFDPNVSDPLVIEYGMEKYGVEAPMPYVVRAALYSDIFRMKVKDPSTFDGKVDVYHSKNLSMKKSKSHGEKLNSKAEKSTKFGRRFSSIELGAKPHHPPLCASNSFQESLARICEQADPEEAPEYTAAETEATIMNIKKKALSAANSLDSEEGIPSRKASISDDDTLIFSPDQSSPKKKSLLKTKLGKGLRKLSITDALFSSSSTPSTTTTQGAGGRRMSLPVFASLPDFKHKSSSSKPVVKAEEDVKPEPKSSTAIYVNMVDEKPELFAPLDKLIPRPAKSFCDTPLYLCLRMGTPLEKPPTTNSVIHFSHKMKPPTTNSVIHFSHKMKPEYWFSIPKDSVDDLYFFFLRWCPEKYGDIDKIDMTELGFHPIEEDDEVLEEKVTHEYRKPSFSFPWRRKSKDDAALPHASSPEGHDWEFLDYMGAKSDVVHPPELSTPSKTLNDEQILQLNKELPARAMNPWELIYGTTDHGFSLKTMYRAMAKYDSPVLVIVVNRKNATFGAYLSSPLRMSDHFYGTGESFLFTFFPEFKVYRWTGENDYFIKGNTDSFMVGSSEGHFGLWLDDDLFRGRTNACQTFGNEPLCPEEDFEVKSLEAWAFVC